MSKKIDVDIERDEEARKRSEHNDPRNKHERAEPEYEQERRERGARGAPDPVDYEKGEYHGLTPQQIKKIEDARGDKEPSPPPEPPPSPDTLGPDANERQRRAVVEQEEALDKVDAKREAEARRDKKHQ